jgi:hypothetical protein
MKFFELAGEYENLYSNIEKFTDAETGEISEEFIKKLSDIEASANEKALACAEIYKRLNAESEAYENEIDRLIAESRHLKNEAERIKNYLDGNLRQMSITEVKGISGKITYRASQSVEVADVNALPEQYKRIKVEADKVAIKNALKAGTEINGCKLIENQSIQIK